MELSNNLAERMIKPFVIDRKNFLFANTPRGADASARIYSLVETAKANELNPYDYLLWISLSQAPAQEQRAQPQQAERLLPLHFPR